jgi:hypothetical protein
MRVLVFRITMLLRRCNARLGRAGRAQELSEEMAFNVALLTCDSTARGLSPEEVRYEGTCVGRDAVGRCGVRANIAPARLGVNLSPGSMASSPARRPAVGRRLAAAMIDRK